MVRSKKFSIFSISTLLVLVTLFLFSSCEASFDGSTAIQEVFAKDLYEEDVYLDKGGLTLTLEQDSSVPETILYYEICFYKLDEGTTETEPSLSMKYENPTRLVSIPIDYTAIQRGNWEITVYGYCDKQRTDGSYVEVCRAKYSEQYNEEYYVLENNQAEVTLTLKDAGHVFVSYVCFDETSTVLDSKYYLCLRCNKVFSSDDFENPLDDANIPAHKLLEGNSIHSKAKDATCGEDGYIEHYECELCGLYFSDEDCTVMIDKDSVVIPKTGNHTLPNSWEANSKQHWKECTVCHQVVESTIANHNEGYLINNNYHCKGCTTCNEPSGVWEPHDYELDNRDGLYYCSECGHCKSSDADTNSGGFEPTQSDIEPLGHFTGTKEGTTWTFTFVDDNPAYPSTVTYWAVDNINMGTENTLTVNISTSRQVYILCVFKNDNGSGSSYMAVYGSDDSVESKPSRE